MKDTKPVVVRYCPYKNPQLSLSPRVATTKDSFEKASKRRRLIPAPARVLPAPARVLPAPARVLPAPARVTRLPVPDSHQLACNKIKSQPDDLKHCSGLIEETLATIQTLLNSNVSVTWSLSNYSDVSHPLHPDVSHPLHNVTLVTTEQETEDDVTDMLEELEDLWKATQRFADHRLSGDEDERWRFRHEE